jgi:hypothetical protein
MKVKQLLALLAFSAALAATANPAAIGPADPCLAFCAKVRCVPEKICGQYVNSNGQTVCGCHERP